LEGVIQEGLVERAAVVGRLAIATALVCLLAAGLAQSVGAVQTPPDPKPHVGNLEVGPAGAQGTVFVRDGTVTVRGPIDGDLLVIRGNVQMAKGGSITGRVAVVHGEYVNKVNAPVGEVSVTNKIPEEFGRLAAQVPGEPLAYGPLLAGFALWAVVTLIVSVIAHIASPRRSMLTRQAVAARPWMTVFLGLCVAAVAAVVVVLDLLLFKFGAWVPVGAFLLFVIALAGFAAVALGYGSALEQVGGGALARIGKTEAGPIAKRATGVGVLFVLKAIPVIGLAVALFEVGMLLSGLGASVQTGLGSAPEWLARRMRAPEGA
jgi:hypothetical protein